MRVKEDSAYCFKMEVVKVLVFVIMERRLVNKITAYNADLIFKVSYRQNVLVLTRFPLVDVYSTFTE